MRAGSGASTSSSTRIAAAEAAERAAQDLGTQPDAALVFFTPEHRARAEDVAAAVGAAIGTASIAGCSAAGVVANGREVEAGTAISVWVAALEGGTARAFAATLDETPGGQEVVGLPELRETTSAVILLADPFSFPLEPVLENWNDRKRGVPIIGGMASAGVDSGDNVLLSGLGARRFGATGLVLDGVAVTPVLSQGCKPIGQPLVVTAAEDNVIYELAGQPPLTRLRDALQRLDPKDQLLIADGLQIGIVLDQHKESPASGDFLIRPLRLAHLDSGAVAVGDSVAVGQAVQFQLRDPSAADEDLKMTLKRARSELRDVSGALLFTCNGRGTSMFGRPHHDADCILDEFGPIPMAGMFCAGEIGPVAKRNFLHGFSASIALFGSASPEPGPATPSVHLDD